MMLSKAARASCKGGHIVQRENESLGSEWQKRSKVVSIWESWGSLRCTRRLSIFDTLFEIVEEEKEADPIDEPS